MDLKVSRPDSDVYCEIPDLFAQHKIPDDMYSIPKRLQWLWLQLAWINCGGAITTSFRLSLLDRQYIGAEKY